MRAINLSKGSVLVERGEMATSVFSRAKGLLGRSGISRGEGLLIRPCQSVHTFFMRFPIDVLFLDRENRVIHMELNLRPNRLSRHCFRARAVLELPAGTACATMTELGDKLAIVSS